jgi:PAS domain S-box-containing protein
MSPKPTYEELEQRLAALENELARRPKDNGPSTAGISHWETIIDGLPGIFYLFDENGRFVRWNRNFESVSGYSADEIAAMTPPDFFDAAEKEEVQKQIRYVFTYGQAQVEAWFVSKNGGRTPFFFSGIRVLIDSLPHLAGLGIDMTRFEQAESELKERERNYRSFFENHHAMMLLIDPGSAEILDANPAACAYYGYSRDIMKTMKITEINQLSREEVFAEMRRAESQKRNYFNFRHRLSTGVVRDVEVYSGPINLRHKTLLYSIIHDVTERNQAAAERERLIAALQEALAEVKTLRGFIPICANCKKIRDDEGYWKQVEVYIQARSEAVFSHSICPECTIKLYPWMADKITESGQKGGASGGG